MSSDSAREITMDPVQLKLMRIKQRLCQYQVVAAVSIAPCRLTEIESGRRHPSPELLARILSLIQVNADV